METRFCQIDLLRHGALETPDLFCAPLTEPLSNTGWQQLEQATKNNHWDVIITSPYQRCVSFAEHLAQATHTPLTVQSAFAEMDFGDWTGMTRKAVWQQYPDALNVLWTEPEQFQAPNGESMQAFSQRVQEAWHALTQAHQNKQVLLLTHAGVMRTILATTFNMPYLSSTQFQIQYAHFTRLQVYADGASSLITHGVSRL